MLFTQTKDGWPTTELVGKVKRVRSCINSTVREANPFHPMCPSDDIACFEKITVGDNQEMAVKRNKFLAFIFITEDKGEIPALEHFFF